MTRRKKLRTIDAMNGVKKTGPGAAREVLKRLGGKLIVKHSTALERIASHFDLRRQ
jgi:hypothetical protein